MDWSITEVARLAGTTSRTLRHYDRIGLLAPSRVGSNGYRYYDEAALVRLQRVLLLRELGVGLPAIAEMLGGAGAGAGAAVGAAVGVGAASAAGGGDGGAQGTGVDAAAPAALRRHLEHLESERSRLMRQIASVRKTIETLEGGGQLMIETMFDGFDHTRYEAEVAERWGSEAAARGSAWWTSKSPAEKASWQSQLASLNADWAAAASRGLDAAGDEAQALARRHAEWLAGVPGAPGAGSHPTADYLTGLGELYVADERFAANYGGVAGATFVRDALAVYAASLQ